MSKSDFKYDVFISYSSYDGLWVHNYLLRNLEGAGIKVCIDTRDFIAGIPSLENMEQAVENSRTTIFVLSENWVQSQYTNFESYLSQTCDPNGLGGKILPVLFGQCDIPLRLKMLSYIDFTKETTRSIAMKKLTTQITTICKNPIEDTVKLHKKETYAVIFTGECKDLTGAQVDLLQAMFRELAKDHTLEIRKMEAGSVILKIIGNRDGYHRLHRLIQTHELDKLMNKEFKGITLIENISEIVKPVDYIIRDVDPVICHRQNITGFENIGDFARSILPPETVSIYNVTIYLTAYYLPEFGHLYYAHSNYKIDNDTPTTKVACQNFYDAETLIFNILNSGKKLEEHVTREEAAKLSRTTISFIIDQKIMKNDGSCEIDLNQSKNIKVIQSSH